MCGCDCCIGGDPTCFDPSQVDTWASSRAWKCGCTCGNCLSRVIDGAFHEGQRLGQQMGVQAARDAVAAVMDNAAPTFAKALAAIDGLKGEQA